METQRLDNGLLPVAWLCNVIFPLAFAAYYAIETYLYHTDNSLVITAGSLFGGTFLLIFLKYRRIEFDRQHIYIKTFFNKTVDVIHFENAVDFDQALLTFGASRRSISGKNYRIIYRDRRGHEHVVKVMSTGDDGVIERFKRQVEDRGRFADLLT